MKNKVLSYIKEKGFDGEKSQMSTKDIADGLGMSTKKVYNFCIELESENKLSKVGYRVKDGWEDVEHSNHHFNSLTWGI